MIQKPLMLLVPLNLRASGRASILVMVVAFPCLSLAMQEIKNVKPYSDNYWGEDLCGGMGVVIQTYNISEGNLQANKNGPIVCANGKGFDGYPDFNEFVVESNGSLLWSLNQQRFWKTSC